MGPDARGHIAFGLPRGRAPRHRRARPRPARAHARLLRALLVQGRSDHPKTSDVNEAVRYTPADQAARYVSLAYTLGQPPAFDAPQRADDLPSGVLDVLDFVPLLREFYKQSGMDARMSTYV